MLVPWLTVYSFAIPVMSLLHHRLLVETTAPIQFVDLTAQLRAWVATLADVPDTRHGLLVVTSPHTTARLTRNEREDGLQRDMLRFLERLAPADAPYEHNRAPVDDRLNAHSHLLGLFMPASETFVVRDGALQLGGWQSLFLVELDGPRPQREVQLVFMPAPTP